MTARNLFRLVGAVSILTAAAGRIEAQDPLGTALAELERRSEAGDSTRALALADSLVAAFPDHPNVILRRAQARARAGRPDDALSDLRRLLGWDPRFAKIALGRPGLEPLRPRLGDVDLNRLVDRAGRPIARGRMWATIVERDLVPEGTAWDSASRSVLVGSLNKHKIVAISPTGVVRDRVPRGSHGLRSVCGIHVDPVRGILWATSNRRYDQESDTAQSVLYAFDPRTGAFRGSYPVPDRGRHFLNDVTTGSDGTVYVTDTEAGVVWTLPRGAKDLRVFRLAEGIQSPNGITSSPDGRHLFVAGEDHIRVVSLPAGPSWRLAVPDSLNVAGIDGLAFSAGGLIAHYPGGLWRLVRYELDPSMRSITGRYLLENMTPDGNGSTTGEVVGNEYVYIGNSQIDRMNAGTVDSAAMDQIRMYRAAAVPEANGVVAVSLSRRDSIALFDAQTLERIGTLPVGKNPHELAIDPRGRRGFVANAGDTSITVFEVEPRPRVVATWSLPDSIKVHDVAVSADGRTVWAASGERRLVLALEAGSGRVQRRYRSSKPGGWMLETGGPNGAIVVSHLEGGAVSLLAPATGAETILPAVEGEIDAAPRPGGTEVWSINTQSGRVTVHDRGKVVARLESGPSGSRVMFRRDGRVAVAVNDGDSTLTTFDAETKRRLGSVTVPGGPKVIALSRDGRRAYVTHPEREALTMVDLGAMKVLRTVPVAGTPDGVAVLGEGRPSP